MNDGCAQAIRGDQSVDLQFAAPGKAARETHFTNSDNKKWCFKRKS